MIPKTFIFEKNFLLLWVLAWLPQRTPEGICILNDVRTYEALKCFLRGRAGPSCKILCFCPK